MVLEDAGAMQTLRDRLDGLHIAGATSEQYSLSREWVHPISVPVNEVSNIMSCGSQRRCVK